jgi:acetyl-CoA acetyltransferase
MSPSANAFPQITARSVPRNREQVDDVILAEGLYGGGIGVAAMCAGGGTGSAAVIEVPAP